MSTSRGSEPVDPWSELRVALAEAEAEEPGAALRARLLGAAGATRSFGSALDPPEAISGVEAFRRVATAFGRLLGDLAPEEWARPTAVYEDVRGVVGHLVGVEEALAAVLAGGIDPAIVSGHAAMTQRAIADARDRPAAAVLLAWSSSVAGTLGRLGHLDAGATVQFYAAAWPLDASMVIRAFEMWTHDEDIRRATGRPLAAPEPAVLARMTQLAVSLLPVALAGTGRAHPSRSARLVLTGPGGGTWDVAFDPASAPRPADARIVVDAGWFCRIVGARADAAAAAAVVTGDSAVADDLLVSAATLALD